MSKNYYLTKEVKKLDRPRTQELQKQTGISVGKHIMIVGQTGSGKTNCLIDFLSQSSRDRGVFHRLILTYKTDEPLYDFLQTKLGKQMQTYKRVEDTPPVSVFKDLANYEEDEEPEEILVIFDDCVNEKGKNLDKIKEYFTYGRKKGITLCFLTQSYYGTDKFIRKNVSYILLLQGLKKMDKQMIARDIADLSTEKFTKIYKHATTAQSEDEIPFLKVCTIACDENKRLSRNWLDYYQIEDEQGK